ncbi:MAG: MotA/TolQ/ExbB proton channel family protein [Cellvibrionaceae bacterium]
MTSLDFSAMRGILAQLNPLAELEAFLAQGGVVLTVIMLCTFTLWMLILERFYYFWRVAKKDRERARNSWQGRSDSRSWYARQIRRRLISILRNRSEHNLHTIKAVVAIAPLLGLLGTVTGMIDVFDVMAYAGSGNTRAMAAGVSKATIPTMAGMVVALTGMLCGLRLQRQLKATMEAAKAQLELKTPGVRYEKN